MKGKHKRRNEKRNARKGLDQVAPVQSTYKQARDCNSNNTAQRDETLWEHNWKNIDDIGAGVTHFLWKEEQMEYKTQLRENELKMWKAMDEKDWKETQETPPAKRKHLKSSPKRTPKEKPLKN